MLDQNKICFVIAPIGSPGSPERERSDSVLEYVIRPAVRSLGYKAARADELNEPGIITTQIIRHLVDDPLVVADLTGANPNVYYELAIRHASGKPYVQIIQQGERLPFDVSPLRTIMFDHRDLRSANNAVKDIEQQVTAIHASGGHADNPISAALDFEALRQRHFGMSPPKPNFDKDGIRNSTTGFTRTNFAFDFSRAGVEARAENGAVTRGDGLALCFQHAEFSNEGLELWLTIENCGLKMYRWFGCTLTAYASPVYAEIGPTRGVGASSSLIDVYPGEQFTCYYSFSFGSDARGPKFLTCNSWDKTMTFWWARGA